MCKEIIQQSKGLMDLKKFADKYKQIYLYGAGDFGHTYKFFLDCIGIKVDGFIVTRDRSLKEDIPVYLLSEFLRLEDIEKYGIILAVGKRIQSEIKQKLPNYVNVFSQDDEEIISIREYLFGISLNNVRDMLKYPNLYSEFLNFTNKYVNSNSLNYIIDNKIIDFNEIPQYKFNISNVAIILQGPIKYEDDFTLKTAIYYRRIYPLAKIIISTWIGECDKRFIEECKKFNITILQNDMPRIEGVLHVNCQIKSSLYGVEYVLDDEKIEYIIKTRTDWRITRCDFLIYFLNLSKAFPINNNLNVDMKDRIIVPCFSEFPFFIGDFYMFGSKEDIYKLFNIPEDKQQAASEYINDFGRDEFDKKIINSFNISLDKQKNNPRDDVQNKINELLKISMNIYNPEIYIYRTFFDMYYQRINVHKILNQYKIFLKNYVCVANTTDLLAYWYKYDNNKDRCMKMNQYWSWLSDVLNP